ncbi:HlyD family secretion protein [Chitinophaga pendula]|uniref:HlyD family secretion protein n=1 Tax=Chitinophaga TaxID=79328 RepID=UPI000BAEDF8D|nr:MULTISPECIES: HlyD family secretion protein [Chitinophaga]ASZ12998.1 multidrug transporter [Chitinophaga sp. MD30]UCJ09371.1 HlyD family secretion protein [Chitinophaga pendula]
MNQQHKSNRTDKVIARISTGMAILVVLCLVVWGGRTLLYQLKYEETNDAQVDEYINPVTVKVTGYIAEIRYEENQEVKKGDTLVLIDNREYAAHQEEAVAALHNAEAQIGVLRSAIHTSGQSAKVSEAQISAAKARLWHHEQEYERYRKLYDVESATRQQLEREQAALEVARSEYAAAQETYAAALARIEDARTQQDVAIAEVGRRSAILKKNELDVSYTVINAPYDGKMGRRTIQPGQLVQAGQTLAYIVDHEAGKWVIANFKETQIRHMHIGEQVAITVDAYPGQRFSGTIVSLSAATGSRFSLLPPDNATGNFVKIAQRIPVRIQLNGPPETLRWLNAGMSAIVCVVKNQKG